jgi:hypothetical protein
MHMHNTHHIMNVNQGFLNVIRKHWNLDPHPYKDDGWTIW